MVPSDIDYRIRASLEMQPQIRGMTALHRQLRSLNSSISQVTRSFALLSAIYGVQRLTRAFTRLNAEVQNAEVSIGGAFSAITGTELRKSIGIARRELRGLRADAAKLPGELSDYIRTYQQVTGAALGAGASTKDIRRLTRLGIVGASAANPLMGMRNIGFDITQALTAGANARTTKDLVLLMQPIGMTVEAFNELSKPERLAAIFRALEKYTEAAKVMGRTWDAQTATFRDNFAELARTATRPLFDVLTLDLIEFNEWLERNNAQLTRWAELVGGTLVGAYERLKLVTPAGVWNAVSAPTGAAVTAGILGRAAPYAITGATAGIGSAAPTLAAYIAQNASLSRFTGSTRSLANPQAWLQGRARQRSASSLAFFEEARGVRGRRNLTGLSFGRLDGQMKLPSNRSTRASRAAAIQARAFRNTLTSIPTGPGAAFPRGRGSFTGRVGGMLSNAAGGIGAFVGAKASSLAVQFSALAGILGPLVGIVGGLVGAFLVTPRLFGETAVALWNLVRGVGQFLSLIFKIVFLNPAVSSMFTALVDGLNILTRVVGLTFSTGVYWAGELGRAVGSWLGFDIGAFRFLDAINYTRGMEGINAGLDAWAAAIGLRPGLPFKDIQKEETETGSLDPLRNPVSDTTNNFNGPITVNIRPERIDNPNQLARDMQSVFDYLEEYQSGRRGRLAPRSS